jgi:hypothetical protein
MNPPRRTTGSPSRRPARAGRGGYVLVEVAMAVLVLLAAMTLTVKALGVVGAERRTAERRLWALQEVANLQERVGAEPFDKVTTDRVKSLADEAEAAAVLPGAGWEAEVADDGPGAKRVTVRLRWKGRSGETTSPVALTSWVYKKGGRS